MNEMDETAIFKIKAIDFISFSGKEKIIIKARYPLAPPCPTDAYKNAITGSTK